LGPGRGSGAVLEAPALVAGLNDVAVVGQAVEESRGHLGVAEHAGPFAEGQVCRHDHGRLLVETADKVEQQLSAGLGERQIAELIEHDEVHAAEIFGHPSLAAGAALGRKLVEQIDNVEEAATLACADAGASDRDGKVGLAGSGSADQHEVSLMSQEVAAGQVADKALVDRHSAPTRYGRNAILPRRNASAARPFH